MICSSGGPSSGGPFVPRRAMILAAGLGERMRPLSTRRAKPALPILNRPLIFEIARRLAAAGVEQVVVNLHWRGETVRQALGDGSALGVSITYSEEPERPLGTGGGIRRARRWLEGEPFLLLNGDSLPGCDFAALVRAHRKMQGLATLVVRPLRPGERYRPVEADAGGRLWRIAGRPAQAPAAELRPYVFTGVHIIEPGLFEFLPDREIFDINADVYPVAMAAGRILAVHPDSSPWYEFGSPESYLTASLRILESGGLQDAPERALRSGLYAAEGVQGLEEAVREGRVTPPVWIGAGARLAAGTRLARCILGSGCEIEAEAAVEGSILMAGARVGARARLRDVVAEEGIEIPGSVQLDSQVLVRENGSLASSDLSAPRPC